MLIVAFQMEQQYPDLNCDALNTERTRLLTESADLNAPLHSSKTEAERDAEITQVNGKLYAICSVRQELSCCGECPVVFGCAVVLSPRCFTPFVIGERVPRTISRPPEALPVAP